ncbi:gamma-glutamyltransferase [Gemmatimonas sp.]|uniref:gamma-glutamyltransferase n=1 Tax=Gemmatimonas sp. TaxID=1962908 RepID=UPI0027BAB617|nr:gamma-glutamyltransferase [Gemmatimonas sp.]
MLTIFRPRVRAIGALVTSFTLAAPLWPLAAQPAARPAQAVEASKGMVVSASAIASQVGRDVLANGGNAIDAAIATGFALAVTYPTAGNIGGGGFMVIRFPDGRATTIDFRERAPGASTPSMFTDSAGTYSARIHHGSHKAVGVPGTVAGFDLAHRKYGRVSWAKLVDPAARMADSGFFVPTGLAASLGNPRTQERLSAYPATIAAYYRDGKPYAAGERMKLTDLGNTLGRIRDLRRDGFYKGTTAHLIVAEMKKNGGLISEQDLAGYEAKERAAVRGTFKGYEIITMPPPSSGGVAMLEMLNILEGVDLRAVGHNTPLYLHYLAESMRRAFRDRAIHLGDPDFTKPPVERLTSKRYATTLRAGIDTAKASPSSPADVTQGYESDETTHYSVVDKDGLAVSVTYTLEAGYGLGAVVEGAGFLLNNEMGDFNGKPGLTDSTGLIGTAPNVAQPGKRMLSSMTPTIVAKDGKLVAVVGSPGGRTIINTVMQVVLNLTAFDMPVQQAVNAARMHHQWLPNAITVERDGIEAATIEALKAKGHVVRVGAQQGTAHSIAIDARTGARLGAPDPRDRDAGAAGHN